MAANTIDATAWLKGFGVFLSCSLALLGPVGEARAGTPLNSAVLIYDRATLINAPQVVERIAEFGDRRVMFVVTMHCRLTPTFQPTQLGLMGKRYKPWKDPTNFEPLSDELLAFCRERLTAAFGRAAELGLDIAVLPHFDPAGEVIEWRNHFDFGPRDLYDGFSYESSVIDPCLAAINATATEKTRIDFSLAGEMGRSVFANPGPYRKLMERIRNELQGRPVSVGVSLNHNDLAGGHESTREEIAETQRLLDDCDFIGFSNYRPFQLPPTAEHFGADCQAFLGTLEGIGINIPLTAKLHFSEIGIGGAPVWNREFTVENAAAEPWEGTARGPRNPWASDSMKGLRRDYHNALLAFLETQPGPRHVEAAYLWSEGSWDPLGIDQPQFVDPVIRRRIAEHNARARQ